MPHSQPNDQLNNQSVWDQFTAISAARKKSMETVECIRQQLLTLEFNPSNISSVVLCGSLARLDASKLSDVDLIVVLTHEALLDDAVRDASVDEIWSCLGPLGLERPQGDGIFATPTSRHELCDGPCGVVAEDIAVFGKRIHLLLESRSVFGDAACLDLQRAILTRYANHPFAERPGEFWQYLTSDLIRYWRSYSMWRHWDIKTSAGGWYMRNVKLRHSRLLTYASLLLACVVDELERPSVDSLLEQVALTPLERLRRIDHQLEANAFDEICDRYDDFLKAINDSAFRLRLQETKLLNPQEAIATAPKGFVTLLDNADRLRSALMRLFLLLPDDRVSTVLAGLLL